MKFYLISDNVDTLMGMHLAGIEGVVVHEDSEVRETLQKAMDMPDVAPSASHSRNSRQARQRSCQRLYHTLCP